MLQYEFSKLDRIDCLPAASILDDSYGPRRGPVAFGQPLRGGLIAPLGTISPCQDVATASATSSVTARTNIAASTGGISHISTLSSLAPATR